MKTTSRTPLAALAAIAVLAVCAAPAGASIVVGKSIGGLNLGMSQTQAKAKLQQPPKIKTVPDQIAGTRTDFTWQGITASFAGGGTMSNIETTLPTERTSSGVGVGSTLAKVKSGLTGETCSGSLCTIGKFTAGQRVTTFRLKAGRVSQVGVGFVID